MTQCKLDAIKFWKILWKLGRVQDFRGGRVEVFRRKKKKKRSLGSPISRVGWFDLLGERGNVRDAQSAPVNIRSQILNE